MMKILVFILISCCLSNVLGVSRCPASYPYAYYDGKFCCKYNQERNRFVPTDKTCDGSVISYESRCCKDYAYDGCPSPPCVNYAVIPSATGTCPCNYPNAYSQGNWCCKYDKEKVYKPQGKLCDGGKISIDSKCCYKDGFTACPKKPCSNYSGKSQQSSSDQGIPASDIPILDQSNNVQGRVFPSSVQGRVFPRFKDILARNTPTLDQSNFYDQRMFHRNSYDQGRMFYRSEGVFRCPASYPYAYYDGKFCCKYNQERNRFVPTDKTCDGSVISYESRCCKDYAYDGCPSLRCVNYADVPARDYQSGYNYRERQFRGL